MKLQAPQAGARSWYHERADHGRRFSDADDDVRITGPNEVVCHLWRQRCRMCEHDDVEALFGRCSGGAGAGAGPVDRGMCRVRCRE